MANVSIRNVFTQSILTFDNDAGYAYTHDGVSGFLVVKSINNEDVVLMVFDDAVDQIGDKRTVKAPIDMNHVFSTSLTVEDTEDYFDEGNVIVDPPQNFRIYYGDWDNPYDTITILKIAIYLIDGKYHVMREVHSNNVITAIVPSGYNMLTANGIVYPVQFNPIDYDIVSPVTGIGGLEPPISFPASSFLALMPGYVYNPSTNAFILEEDVEPPQPATMPVGAIRWDGWYPKYFDGNNAQTYKVLSWLPDYVNDGELPWDLNSNDKGANNIIDVAWTMSAGQSMVNPEYYQYRPFHTIIDTTPETYAYPYFSGSVNDFITDNNVRTSSIDYQGHLATTMNAEVDFALEMGLDYWMFLFYGDNSPLCYGRRLFRGQVVGQSVNRKTLKMAYCTHQLGGSPLGANGTWIRGLYDNSIDEIVDAMEQTYYQKTQDGKPIVFLDYRGDSPTAISEMAQIKADITSRYSLSTGIYWVLLVISTAEQEHYDLVNTLGCDSLTWYAQSGDNNDYSYKTSIHKRTIDRLNMLFTAKGNKDITPCFTGSFFNKPMWTHSLSGPINWGNANVYTNVANPSEYAEALSEVVQWANARNCKTMIIYAWNEHYEGGIVLCPRQKADGTPNTDYVNAVKGVLNP